MNELITEIFELVLKSRLQNLHIDYRHQNTITVTHSSKDLNSDFIFYEDCLFYPFYTTEERIENLQKFKKSLSKYINNKEKNYEN